MACTNTVVLDRGNNTTLTINLHGATIVSWRINNEEQLFVSRQAIFDGKKAIYGGIPFIFPQFGDWTFGPEHGFARIVRWNIEKGPETMASGDIEVTFTLTDNEFTHSMWNFKFRIRYRLILREKELRFYIEVENLHEEMRFNFHLLLQTHFKVPDVRHCTISGLHGCSYIDRLVPTSPLYTPREGRKLLTINERIDRVYENTANEHIITNVASGRKMRIQTHNFPDTVIWNPWQNPAMEPSDFYQHEYLNMVCLGTGFVSGPIILFQGVKYEATQIFKIE